mmetsp:Transcript_94011/g.166467  ORF Transcript_94011/g.166467 Transcript_94011/m.166467 type:complete len:355 (-) Transcript_94011:113-1177(-)
MSVEYDTNDGIFITAVRISKTIIPEVVVCKEFWILLILNITVRTLRAYEIFEPEANDVDLPWKLTGVTGSLMAFFVCFYNGHQFTRYNMLYEITQELNETLIELNTKLRVELPNRAVQRKVAKLVLASIYIFYFERTGSGDGGGKISKAEFYQLWKLDLLDEQDIRAVKAHCRHLKSDSIASFLVLQWAIELFMHHTEDKPSREDMLAGFQANMYTVRRCQTIVTQTMELPMPFQYFHIMNLMLMLNLVLWAYSLGCEDSYFAPIIYMFVQMMFQGLRELSTSLSDPFGQDEVDFDINDWMKSLYSRIHSIMEDDFDFETLGIKHGDHKLAPLAEVRQKVNAHVDLESNHGSFS